MNMVYIAAFDVKWESGVYKKVKSQVAAFNAGGIRTKLLKLRQTEKTALGVFTNTTRHWEEIRLPGHTDCLYIRYQKSDFRFIRFLKRCKKQYGVRKIVVELPTYPYRGEDRKEDLPVVVRDLFYQTFLKKYVDAIATFSEDERIFGIQTIRITNGIDFGTVAVRKTPDTAPSQIHLIGVSSMRYWHGYDRVLEGLYHYYRQGGQRNIFFHVVGNGPEMGKLRNMVRRTGLKEHVIFHGTLEGEELDKVYDKCAIGVASLGIHRKQIRLSSELKSREYMAKGLPIISAGEIDIFRGQEHVWNPFLCPADESPLDIGKVVLYYDRIYTDSGKTPGQIAAAIRSTGEKLCGMKAAMNPVIRYFLGDKANEEVINHEKRPR